MKQCSQCKCKKPLSEFYKRNDRPCGYRSECKKCSNLREKTLSRIAYKQEYEKTPKRKKYNAEHEKSPKCKAMRKRYRQSEKGREVFKKKHKRYCKNNPEKRKAKDAVHGAVRSGKFPKFSEFPCKVCGEKSTEYHHHLGYAEEHWLDVIPVCKICHMKLHCL